MVSCNGTVELCDKSGMTEYQNYTAENTEPCDCDDYRFCLRKCCQHGYYHNRIENHRYNKFEGVCLKNTNSSSAELFSVPVYNGTVLVGQINKYIIGMLQCNNTQTPYQYFKMSNSNPKEKYYVQFNGSLYYPSSNRKIYDNRRFCVDEEEGLSVYLCYSPERLDTYLERKVSASGKYSYILRSCTKTVF